MSEIRQEKSSQKRSQRQSKTALALGVQAVARGPLDMSMPKSPFSKQLDERIDMLGLLVNSEEQGEAVSDFLRHFDYLQQEYIRPLFEEAGDINFMREYQITPDDGEHPDHYALIRLMASMVEQCQPDKSPNLSSEDLMQMSHIAGR